MSGKTSTLITGIFSEPPIAKYSSENRYQHRGKHRKGPTIADGKTDIQVPWILLPKRWYRGSGLPGHSRNLESTGNRFMVNQVPLSRDSQMNSNCKYMTLEVMLQALAAIGLTKIEKLRRSTQEIFCLRWSGQSRRHNIHLSTTTVFTVSSYIPFVTLTAWHYSISHYPSNKITMVST